MSTGFEGLTFSKFFNVFGASAVPLEWFVSLHLDEHQVND